MGKILEMSDLESPGEKEAAFLRALGEWYALIVLPNSVAQPQELADPGPPGEQNYVELAAGYDFMEKMPRLRPDRTYFAVERSGAVCACLERAARELGITNITPLRVDMESDRFLYLLKTRVGRIGVLRSKGVFAYIAKFRNLEIWEAISDLIIPGGSIVFQTNNTFKQRTIGLENPTLKEFEEHLPPEDGPPK